MTAKTSMPSASSRLRPNPSPNRPPVATRLAQTTPYAVTTSWRTAGLASRSAPIEPSATLTVKNDMIGIITAASAAARPSGCIFSGGRVASGASVAIPSGRSGAVPVEVTEAVVGVVMRTSVRAVVSWW